MCMKDHNKKVIYIVCSLLVVAMIAGYYFTKNTNQDTAVAVEVTSAPEKIETDDKEVTPTIKPTTKPTEKPVEQKEPEETRTPVVNPQETTAPEQQPKDVTVVEPKPEEKPVDPYAKAKEDCAAQWGKWDEANHMCTWPTPEPTPVPADPYAQAKKECADSWGTWDEGSHACTWPTPEPQPQQPVDNGGGNGEYRPPVEGELPPNVVYRSQNFNSGQEAWDAGVAYFDEWISTHDGLYGWSGEEAYSPDNNGLNGADYYFFIIFAK